MILKKGVPYGASDLVKLSECGYILSSLGKHATQEIFSEFAAQLGKKLGSRNIGVKLVEGLGSDEWLPKHTESITQNEKSLLQYFALACIQPSRKGGATCIYDARKAAQLILQQAPELANLRIQYTSTVYPNQRAVHKLVSRDAQFGFVLRYRSKTDTNKILGSLPTGMNETQFYKFVDKIVDSALSKQHYWKVGDILCVNNRITLHSREPYTGKRTMVRFRFDDPHFKNIKIPKS